MSVRISHASSTTVSSSSRGSKSSSSKAVSSSKSNSKTGGSKAASSSKSNSKTSNSKAAGSSKSNSKSSSSKALTSSKSEKKSTSNKTTSSSKGTPKTSSGKVLNTKKNVTNNTKSNVNSSIISTISEVKYIMNAPAIYTSQALKSTIGSSATVLGKNTHKDYVPGMPSRDYEKYKKCLEPKFKGKTPAINRMLNNIDKDNSLKLSDDKKTAMLVAGEKLLNKGYEAKFVAGVLGNIMNEGTPGLFESSCYKDPKKKPPYLVCMQNDFQYDTKYSGKTIGVVGIKETIKLQKQASKKQHTMTVNGEKVLVKDQFGFGMCQFTGSRTSDVLDAYQAYYDKTKINNPTQKQCAVIEADFMISELESDYKQIYDDWKKNDRTAKGAGESICREYERPYDSKKQASERANNATKLYKIMIGKK